MANDNYLKLVTSKHWDKPKFLAWLTANLTVIDDADIAIMAIDADFDIDSAVGNQLDVIGRLVGRSRTLDFQPSVASPTLDDDTYRFVLKAKVAQNQWDGTIVGLYKIWDTVFPLTNIKVTDNQDMTCDILFVGQNFTDLQRELLAHGYIIPKAQCVGTSYAFGGTFSFRTAALTGGTYVAEIDSLAGFSDVTQTDGGFFGSVS
jgi:hypothetical protein